MNNSMDLGQKKFSSNGRTLDVQLIDFWRWNTADLVSNATRGRLAEFIIAQALSIDISSIRREWNAFDLLTQDKIKIEVKSSAFIQSWEQTSQSDPKFSIKESMGWDAETNKQLTEKKRTADVYIFALLHHLDKSTIDPLRLEQWSFFVLTTAEINRSKKSQETLSLGALKLLTQPVTYDELNSEFRKKCGYPSGHGA